MKNKEFFYLQYDKINWENQEKTKINSLVNNFIIKEIISKNKGKTIRIFDIGFGIGFFIKMLYSKLTKSYKNIVIEDTKMTYPKALPQPIPSFWG